MKRPAKRPSRPPKISIMPGLTKPSSTGAATFPAAFLFMLKLFQRTGGRRKAVCGRALCATVPYSQVPDRVGG